MDWSGKTLADAIRTATAPVRITGGGSRAGLGHAVDADPLETGGLSGITLYEPGALTLVARAGTPLSEIEAALASENQQLPFEPMDHRAIYGTGGAPTIGGIVAANVSGPRRIQAGACRDSLIGVRCVTGHGEVIKNGGRVMKNVTGYDLVKLMAGSHGTLGVLTEVSFKLLPKPETSGLVTVVGASVLSAVQAMTAALGSPFDVSAAAHLPDHDGTSTTMIRVEGFEGSVAYRLTQLKDRLAPYGEVSTALNPDADVWAHVRDARPVADGEGDIWRISVKPTDGPAVVDALPDARCQLDWGGGLVWACVPEGTDARAKLAAIPGHATLIRASEPTKSKLGVFHPEPAPLAVISTGLRAKFDPRNILNPGRMG